MRGKSPSGKLDAALCWDYVKGKCDNQKCDLWHPGPCIHYAKNECKRGKNCFFLHGKTAPIANTKKKGDGKGKSAGKASVGLGVPEQPLEE